MVLTPATMVDMATAEEYRKLSFWHETVPGTLEPGDPLSGDLDADVAIAGAGYTGLWTAYYLSATQPGLRVAVCEAEIAGFFRAVGKIAGDLGLDPAARTCTLASPWESFKCRVL